MKKLFICIIKIYQILLSPFLGKNCRFYPTCSSYTIEAIEIKGVFKGSCMGMWRILRCNPFSDGGYDPVLLKLRRADDTNTHETLRPAPEGNKWLNQ